MPACYYYFMLKNAFDVLVVMFEENYFNICSYFLFSLFISRLRRKKHTHSSTVNISNKQPTFFRYLLLEQTEERQQNSDETQLF